MRSRMAIAVGWGLVVSLALPPQGWAQGRHGAGARSGRAAGPHSSPKVLDRVTGMSPEQRRRLLEDLPPDRKERVQQRLDEYKHLSPEERQKLQERFEQFQQLPPEKQEAARRLFARFSKLPEERRKAVQEEFENLRKMEETERRDRLKSDEFRNKFSRSEQRLVEDFSKQLLSPPQ